MAKNIFPTVSKPALSESGFSLTELLVVVVIIGVASAIALPNILSRRDAYYLKATTKDLNSIIQKAKMASIKTNSDWAIAINEAADTYTVYSSDGGDGNWNSGNESIDASVNLASLPGDIFFQEPGGAASTALITLRANGTCQTGNIYLGNHKNITFYRIQISPVCGMTLTRWTGTTWK